MQRALTPVLLCGGILWTSALFSPCGLLAQDGTSLSETGGVVLTQLPMSTRSLALGGALPMGDQDPDLLFRNPALMTQGRGVGATVHRHGRDARVVSMAGATPWLGGGVAIGVRSVTYLAPADAGQPPPARPGARMRFAPPEGAAAVGVSETAVTAGYARVYRGFRVGAALSALEVRHEAASDITGMADIGVARTVGPVVVGLSGGGFGPSMSLPPGFQRVPQWGMAGVGSRPAPVGPLDVAGAFAVTAHEGGDVVAGGGVEVAWWPIQGRTFVGQVGFGGPRSPGASDFALGAAFHGDAISLEYGWRDAAGGTGVHAVSLRFR